MPVALPLDRPKSRSSINKTVQSKHMFTAKRRMLMVIMMMMMIIIIIIIIKRLLADCCVFISEATSKSVNRSF